MDLDKKMMLIEKIKKSACVTGHRSVCKSMDVNRDENARKLVDYFLNIIDKLVERGIENFISGGAYGTDLLFAYAVNISKEKHPHIKNIIAIPFENQPGKLKGEARKFYDDMLAVADMKWYVDTLPKYQIKNTVIGEFHAAKLDKRNHLMVDYSDYVIGAYTGQAGGTKNCLNYANKLKKKIIVTNPEKNFETNYLNFPSKQ